MSKSLRAVVGFPGYFISSCGDLWSSRQGALKRLKKRPHRQGYVRYCLYRDDGKKTKLAHVLVAEAWLPPRPTNHHEVNHKNNIKDDNRKENLEWGTKSHNCKHREKYRVKPAWSGKRTPERLIRAIRWMRAGRSRKWIMQKSGYSRSMVGSIFTGRCGVSINTSLNGHEAKQSIAT